MLVTFANVLSGWQARIRYLLRLALGGVDLRLCLGVLEDRLDHSFAVKDSEVLQEAKLQLIDPENRFSPQKKYFIDLIFDALFLLARYVGKCA